MFRYFGHPRSRISADEVPSPTCFGGQWQSSAVSSDPKEWSSRKKWLHVGIVALLTFTCPLASSIHTPAIPLIAEEFSTNASSISLTVSVYVLGFAAGPFLWLPLSKLYGRLPVYNAANVLLLIGSIACALAPALTWLVAFRFVAGCAAACALTQGSGTVADIISKEERGKAMSIMAFGTVWAPSVGPAIGGRVTEAFGWRACFWLLAFLIAFNTMITLMLMEETLMTRILHQYELLDESLLPDSEDSNVETELQTGHDILRTVKNSLCGPFELLHHTAYRTTALLSALYYSIQIFLYSDIPHTYETEYGFAPRQTGLAFLGLGIGMTFGLVAFGLTSDRIMIALAGDGGIRAEHRLPLTILSALLIALGLAAYGFTAEARVPWIVPIVCNGVTGAGLFSVSMTIVTYLIDLSPKKAVECTVLLAMVRFPMGAVASSLSEGLVLVMGRKLIKAVLAILTLSTLPAIYGLYCRRSKIISRV